jgi:hypothetical protein
MSDALSVLAAADTPTEVCYGQPVLGSPTRLLLFLCQLGIELLFPIAFDSFFGIPLSDE